MEDERHYRFVYEEGPFTMKRKTMIIPQSLEELASYVEQEGKKVSFFFKGIGVRLSAYPPFLPRASENPEFTFISVDRDQYLDLAKLWDIYGIFSLVVVLDKDQPAFGSIVIANGRDFRIFMILK